MAAARGRPAPCTGQRLDSLPEDAPASLALMNKHSALSEQVGGPIDHLDGRGEVLARNAPATPGNTGPGRSRTPIIAPQIGPDGNVLQVGYSASAVH